MSLPRVVLAATLCLATSACNSEPGADAARAACAAYDGTDAALRDEALDEVERRVTASDTWVLLEDDMDDAWARADALAAEQNAGRSVSGSEMDAYFAADETVRADCAAAGNDIGPLGP